MPRAGTVYPLQPRGRRPDTHIAVDAALPEPAALQRPDYHILEALSSPRSLLQPADELLEAFQEAPTKPLNCGIPASQTLTSTGALV